ncbi:MAG: 4'-phosphopantetheinyl transferase superfamily protein [Eubacteriales bacterium]|nr:4'-phosphopantetheinyl transferase superfamily protein [Eubacteriales bacterium]
MKIFFTRRFSREINGIDMSSHLMKKVLHERCGLPSGAEVEKSVHGKPYVDSSYSIYFSITDTENMWLCSTADFEHGTDAEYYSRSVSNCTMLAKRFLTESERRAVISYGIDDNERSGQFIYLWTRKEAYLKYIGQGLAGLSSAPPVLIPPKGTDLKTFVFEGLFVSVCAPEGRLPADIDFICLDRTDRSAKSERDIR